MVRASERLRLASLGDTIARNRGGFFLFPIATLAVFTLAIPDNHGSCDCYHFETVEDVQDALERLYDAEEERSSLSRRDAIADLELQLASLKSMLECEES